MYWMLVYNPKQLTVPFSNQTREKRQKHGFGKLAGVEHEANITLVAHTGNEV